MSSGSFFAFPREAKDTLVWDLERDKPEEKECFSEIATGK
jgi:hypothetical protein